MAVPYTFGTATAAIPLSNLDSNFATTITLGNTAIQLGNTVTTLNNMTLANVTISGGTSSITSNSISNGTSNVSIATSGGAVTVATNGNTAVTVDTSQNVGIGTTTTSINDIISAARPLVVAKSDSGTNVGGASASINIVNTDTTTSNGAQLNFASTYTSGGINTVSAYISTIFGARTNTSNYYAAGTLVFGTNSGGVGNGPGERMRIDSSGNVGIGTTSMVGKLNAVYSGTYGIYLEGAAGSSTLEIFFAAATNVGSISTNGTITAFNSTSDYRLKENIAPMTGALAKVAALKPVTYKWKSDGSDSDGFIAHELAEVFPQAVHGEKDGTETIEIKDEDGNVTGTETRPVYQGIDTSFLVATLAAAIQEQQVLIISLTDRIAALEAK
jgi:hypothetical protein